MIGNGFVNRNTCKARFVFVLLIFTDEELEKLCQDTINYKKNIEIVRAYLTGLNNIHVEHSALDG